jgi:HrpA-like RNA helicase
MSSSHSSHSSHSICEDAGGASGPAAALVTLMPRSRRMAQLLLSPAWSHTLLLAPQFGRVVEPLTCVALLSVEPCF